METNDLPLTHLLSPPLCKLLLLHYKASADVQDNNGNTALHLACAHGHEDVSGVAVPGCVHPFSLVKKCEF